MPSTKSSATCKNYASTQNQKPPMSYRRRNYRILGALLLCGHLLPAEAVDALSGAVVAVQDGDTLTLLVDRQQIRVRLADIDAPERKQAFGTRSRQSLTALCHGKPAKVVSAGRDRYGRTIGHVTCAGIDAQAHQVSTGMAWVFDRYASPSSPLYALQDAARAARRGLWADPSPVPPWDWRKAVP